MSDPQIPRRTAGTCELPNGGGNVWIQTLNSNQKEEAENRARRYAATECRSLLKGGADYEGVVAEVRSLTLEQQASYLAQQDTWRIRQEVEKAFPLPAEPEQVADQTPEAYTQAVTAWEKEKTKVEREREAEEKKRYETAKAGYLALSANKRLEACCTAYYNLEFGQAYLGRLKLENLLRAARDPEDHLQRRFASVEEVEDLDDPVRQALIAKYEELDSLSQAEVPTSPLDSCERLP